MDSFLVPWLEEARRAALMPSWPPDEALDRLIREVLSWEPRAAVVWMLDRRRDAMIASLRTRSPTLHGCGSADAADGDRT